MNSQKRQGHSISPHAYFADYPSLGRGIILQQQQQEQQEEAQQLEQQQLEQQEPEQLQLQQQQQQEPKITATEALPSNVEIKHQQLHCQQRRARPSVLLKPQYACFLQNESRPAQSPPPVKVKPRKAASFSMGNYHQDQQQQSKYEIPDSRNRTTSTTNKKMIRSSSRSGSSQCSSDASQQHQHQQSRRRPSLPSSLALPNASTALLQARIPGTTLYYV